MRFFLFVFTLLFVLTAAAQNITVLVKDSVSGQPLAGATGTVFSNNKEIAAARADAQGRLNLALRQAPNRLDISFVNYSSRSITLSGQDQDLGTISLAPLNFSLQEVVVAGRQAPVNLKLDRQQFKANQYQNAANGTGIDLVKNLPSVTVDGQGVIQFRGSTSFLLLINGKPTQGDPSLILGQLAAGSIESVEVITNPSAAYDAEGRSGAINIITKAAQANGWMLQASVMGGLPPMRDFDNVSKPSRYGADVSAGYRSGKWDLNLGANYLRNDITGFREGDVYTIVNNIKTDFPSTGERSFRRYNYGGRIALGYQASPNDALRLGLYAGHRYQARAANLYYNNLHTNIQTGMSYRFQYYNENLQEKEGNFSLANLDYDHSFNSKSRLTLSGLFERAALEGLTTNKNLGFPNIKDTLQYTLNPYTNPLNAWRLKADYSQQLAKVKWQSGYQYREADQNGVFDYLVKQNGTANYILDPNFSSALKVKDQIHGVYSLIESNNINWYYNVGARMEWTHRTLTFSKASQNNSLDLANFLPSVQIKRKWGNSALRAGYARRIRRTNNYELNPIPEREHSETLEQGDANLQPELIGSYELGFEKTFPKGLITATLYRQQVTNPIQRVNKVFNDTILNRVFTNAGKAIQPGLELNFNYKLTSKWQMSLGGNVYHYRIKGKIFNGSIPVENNGWVYSFNWINSFDLGKNWSSQFNINYLSARPTAQGEDSRFLTPNLSLKKTSANKRWYVQAQWLFIDVGLEESNRQRITTRGSNFYTTTNYIYEPDQIQLSIGFMLNGARKITLPVSEMGEKEF